MGDGCLSTRLEKEWEGNSDVRTFYLQYSYLTFETFTYDLRFWYIANVAIYFSGNQLRTTCSEDLWNLKIIKDDQSFLSVCSTVAVTTLMHRHIVVNFDNWLHWFDPVHLVFCVRISRVFWFIFLRRAVKHCFKSLKEAIIADPVTAQRHKWTDQMRVSCYLILTGSHGSSTVCNACIAGYRKQALMCRVVTGPWH